MDNKFLSPRKYVEDLSHEERMQILRDWEELEKHGVIGDCELRKHAKLVQESYKTSALYGFLPDLSMWMERLAFEIYRIYAKHWFKYIGSLK